MLTEKKKNLTTPNWVYDAIPNFMENIDKEELDENCVRCQQGLESGQVSFPSGGLQQDPNCLQWSAVLTYNEENCF